MTFFASDRRSSHDADLSALYASLNKLGRRLANSGEARTWLDSASSSLGQVGDVTGKGAMSLWRGAGDVLGEVSGSVRRRPASSALLILSAGVLLGLMLSRK